MGRGGMRRKGEKTPYPPPARSAPPRRSTFEPARPSFGFAAGSRGKKRSQRAACTTASALFAPASGRWGNGMPRKKGKKKTKKKKAQRTPRAREQGVGVPRPPLGYLLRPQFPPHLVLIARAPGVGGIESNAASARVLFSERTNWARCQNGGKGADIRALGDSERVRLWRRWVMRNKLENKLRSHTPTGRSMASLGLEDEDSAGRDMILGLRGQVKGTHIVPLCHSRAYLSSQIRPKKSRQRKLSPETCSSTFPGRIVSMGVRWSDLEPTEEVYLDLRALLGANRPYEAIESRRFGLAAGDARTRG
ncbi:hypothetical protein C8F04DRAFT_1189752 [Mycena alexandri]|uniref:Uncharacterized protein n=1 Tax=Mycena alexandri TaxID=1745969 RepID=A0AAD6WU26_9AGAR|nr:hypothetical protein C8F04DRAFT_1189752 [Mycena alexandri]